MTEPEILVCCEVRPGFELPSGGVTYGPGRRLLVPLGFARRWQARGALTVLDEVEGEGS